MLRYRSNYLARRNPAFTHAGFVSRWRQHFELASSLKEWGTIKKYAQCEVLCDESARDYDGFATVEYHSLEARDSNRRSHEYHRILQADELEVFESLVSNYLFIGSHHVLHGEGTGPFKIVRFIRRRLGIDPKKFEKAWREDYVSRLLAAAPDIIGLAQNIPIAPERPEGWGLQVDGSEEIWFPTIEAAHAFQQSEEWRQVLLEFQPHLFAPAAEVVTDEVVLHDR